MKPQRHYQSNYDHFAFEQCLENFRRTERERRKRIQDNPDLDYHECDHLEDRRSIVGAPHCQRTKEGVREPKSREFTEAQRLAVSERMKGRKPNRASQRWLALSGLTKNDKA